MHNELTSSSPGTTTDLIVTSRGGELMTFDFADSNLLIKRHGQHHPKSLHQLVHLTCICLSAGKLDIQVPIRNVIGAYHSDTVVEIYFLSKKQKYASRFHFSKVEGTAKDITIAKKWSQALMDAAYQGTCSHSSTMRVVL